MAEGDILLDGRIKRARHDDPEAATVLTLGNSRGQASVVEIVGNPAIRAVNRMVIHEYWQSAFDRFRWVRSSLRRRAGAAVGSVREVALIDDEARR